MFFFLHAQSDLLFGMSIYGEYGESKSSLDNGIIDAFATKCFSYTFSNHFRIYQETNLWLGKYGSRLIARR